MNYKYNEQFDSLELNNCPPETYKPIKIKTFRWVFEMGNQSNFMPQFMKKPSRFQHKSNEEKCAA